MDTDTTAEPTEDEIYLLDAERLARTSPRQAADVMLQMRKKIGSLREEVQRKTMLLHGAEQQVERMRKNWRNELGLREKLISQWADWAGTEYAISQVLEQHGFVEGSIEDRVLAMVTKVNEVIATKSIGRLEVVRGVVFDTSVPAPGFDVERLNSTEGAPWRIEASILRDFATKDEAIAATWQSLSALRCTVVDPDPDDATCEAVQGAASCPDRCDFVAGHEGKHSFQQPEPYFIVSFAPGFWDVYEDQAAFLATETDPSVKPIVSGLTGGRREAIRACWIHKHTQATKAEEQPCPQSE